MVTTTARLASGFIRGHTVILHKDFTLGFLCQYSVNSLKVDSTINYKSTIPIGFIDGFGNVI